MKITEILREKNKAPYENPPVTIGFLGDSVTQGCFELVPCFSESGELTYNTIFETEASYSAKLRTILNKFYPKAQINIVNAGISGDRAPGGLSRMERDLLPYHPDLTVVCFGLNDSGSGDAGLQQYHDALVSIVRKLKEAGSEVILMTPQPICARKHAQLQIESLRPTMQTLVENFHNGAFERYIQQMRAVAQEENVPLCDVYAKWMALYHSGVDITELLANYLNHPIRDMHWLFAISLAETIFTA